MDRSAGILLPVSALPSPYGIGTLGRAAYEFADFLAAAGQRVWQVLPVGPIGYGDSPYSSCSTFAGNPYYVDLDLLADEGLLDRAELQREWWGESARSVDYGRIYELRFTYLRKALDNTCGRLDGELDRFAAENRWLPDYALFMAIKRQQGMKPWTEWPEGLRLRESAALDRARWELREDIRLFTFIQYEFYKQWDALRACLREKDIRLVGDLPIYAASDSADVWSEPQFFQLDERNLPERVAGVPPDYFSADGQLWGNPLYRWDVMRADGFGWWIRRLEGMRRLFDVVRIDHFRGFESYWSVPAGEPTARNGRWEKGPGMELVGVLRDWFYDFPIIAEDLGVMTDEVRELLHDSGFPGMKVLEFAFDPSALSEYLPHHHRRNCVCYVGTHDNETLVQWFRETDPAVLAFAREYLGLNEQEGLCRGMIRAGMSSVADLFVVQLQDWLELGAAARMNKPGTALGNWRWRVLPEELTEELAVRIRRLTQICARI